MYISSLDQKLVSKSPYLYLQEVKLAETDSLSWKESDKQDCTSLDKDRDHFSGCKLNTNLGETGWLQASSPEHFSKA